MIRFEIDHRDAAGRARQGRLLTERGTIETPAFMPVATVGSVKSVMPSTLREVGAQIVLANTYHLYLRPGLETIRALGGLSRFMSWNGPMLTDSGGFQAFSLGDLAKVDESGVRFRSHLDGSAHVFDPATVVAIQEGFGVDMMMPIDDCAPYPADPQRLEDGVRRSSVWLETSVRAWKRENALFGIVQGGTDQDLRRRSVDATIRHDLPGYALGGLSVGEPKDLFYEMASFTADLLPADRPRYSMGTGTPEDLLRLVDMGYDLFDCVLPTRNARNGTLFTWNGRLNIRNAAFARDSGPVDEDCDCPVCASFTRAYLRHLAVAKEMLSATLNTIHNLAFYFRLLRECREALERGEFPEYRTRALVRLSKSAQPR